MSILDLQRCFGLPGVITIEEGPNSLPRVSVAGELASAEIYLHGAHLTKFQPRGEAPVLFMSEESHFDAAKPIRGGIPVIFPWFGPHPQKTDLPMHGYARIRAWTLESCAPQADGSVRAALTLAGDDVDLRLAFGIGRTLEVELDVRAREAALTFEEALHTYFAVGDVRQVEVAGLENTDFIDKVDAKKRKTQPKEPVRISGETDRVYLNTTKTCIIRDPVLKRTITVEKENSATTVVWNPWIAKAKVMADFGDDEWPKMICVETANAGESAVRLDAGQTHRLRARIKVSKENNP